MADVNSTLVGQEMVGQGKLRPGQSSGAETDDGQDSNDLIKPSAKLLNTDIVAPLGKPAIVLLLAGCLIAFILLFVEMEVGNPKVNRTAAVAVLMATLWISEAIPLAATSLIPLCTFPFLGVGSAGGIASQYFNDTVFLLVGGFLVAICMEKWQLHNRIALRIMLIFGTKPKFLLLGSMVSTWFLSMWISNTATTMMMIPNIISIMAQIENLPGQDPVIIGKMSRGMYLGLAYSASIGGVSTKIGTPPNLVLLRIYQLLFPNAPEISFGVWFSFGLPISFLLLMFVWGVIIYMDMPPASDTRMQIPQSALKKKYTDLGVMMPEERVIAVCFFTLACLWFFRTDLGSLPGWASYLPEPGYARDGTTAIGMSVILFCLPAHLPSLMPGGATDEENNVVSVGRPWNTRMLAWSDAKKLPWDMVLLFGGGFALANGFVISGLSVYLGNQLEVLGSLPLFFTVFLFALIITFLTEITSNTATSNVLLPIVGAVSVAIKVHPLVLMIPSAMACSFAFMMPMATPPNLLAFATGKITMVQMCKHGFVINIFAVLIVTIATFTVIPAALGFDVNMGLPEWAVLAPKP